MTTYRYAVIRTGNSATTDYTHANGVFDTSTEAAAHARMLRKSLSRKERHYMKDSYRVKRLRA